MHHVMHHSLVDNNGMCHSLVQSSRSHSIFSLTVHGVNKKVLQEGDVLKYYHNSKQMGSKFPPVESMPKRQRRI